MLACVCQPADPGLFRRSPIPLGAPPLKITSRTVAPIPGRSVRISGPGLDALRNHEPAKIGQTSVRSEEIPQTSESSNENSKNTTRGSSKAASESSSKSSSCASLSAVKKKCAKRCKHSKKGASLPNSSSKSSDKEEISSLTPDSADCDRKLDGKSNDFEKLPDGVQLTLSELREMACRQQAQIDSQHQLLVAKEQRLRYLKEQEARQQRVQAESERLRRLRDRVDAQELKLRKLRALRGQVDHQKQNNISLTSDLDSIRALFNEKEKELSLAVAKVEELTRQLEELRRGRSTRDPPPASALELDKLRRELMYRNKLNEQQNQRLHQQREALTARQEEMSAIDKRISELQERLHRKRLLNQQLANQISAASHKAAYHQLVRLTGNAEQNNQAFARKQQQNSQPNGLSRGNIAAVEPYNHVPLQQQNQQIKNINSQQETTTYHPVYQQNHHIKKDSDSPNSNTEAQELANKMANLYAPRPDENDALKDFTVSKNDPKYQTLPYNTKFTVNLLPNRISKNENSNVNNNDHKEDVNSHISNHVNGNFNLQSTHMTVHSAPLSIVNKNIATPLNQHDLLSRKVSDNKEHGLLNGGEESLGMNQHQKENTYPAITSTSSGTTYQKPISSVAPTSIHHTGILSNVYQTSSIKVQPVEPQTLTTSKNLTSISYNSQQQVQSPQTSILSPPQSSSTPLTGTPDVADKTPKPALPPKPAIKPPPRQTQVLNEESVPPPLPLSEPPDDNKNAGSKNVPASQKQGTLPPVALNNQNNTPISEMIIKAKPLTIKKQPLSEQPKLRTVNTYSKLNGLTSNRRIEMPPTFHFPELQNPEKAPESPPSQPEKDETDKVCVEEPEKDDKPFDGVVRRCKKGNLKQTGKSNLSRRVSFDPLALLLDASLEGELELVKKTATQVANPSAANDEGITALHNAICAGHLEIVKFLVEFGCDVNAQDSDGWTPLHCAASCNNLTMVKFLVEHGACIFATTLSDHETAAEKCEEDEEGFDGCSEYLYSVQEKLGILSGGVVYAVFDYTAQQPDELSFKAGQEFTVLRKGDENEREWWWSRLGDKEGYVPRNLLGLYPRVTRTEE
ncbi:apoptosis-stimulating of p53 protein 1 [Anoplophora glabripennis]|uniref:apoptosis-stimulating of p53 protein 1 n=1 Tax=Anoplophora glabripennis TaxID=217634 RepID=UPI0008756EA0|nr:apoptosis-stimulating of p53 protein 1 [Anoplophora glabripennis]